MEQLDATQPAEEQAPPPAADEAATLGPGTTDPGAGSAPPSPAQVSYVYAIGRVEPRFPSLAVEKELAQLIGRSDSAGLTDREALQRVLADRANRYLARRMCWILMIGNLETYVLAPQDPIDIDVLVDTVRSEPGPGDEIAVVVGRRGPIAPAEACGGLAIPIVVFDQLWSFPRQTLLEAIPKPDGMTKERFEEVAGELFDRVMGIADNAGALDEHRALNYLAVRYPAIYARTAEAYEANASLSAVDVRASRLGGVRNTVDAVFSYTHRETDVTESSFVRVDVTEEFPFLVSRLAPFYETRP
jgi:cyclic patellamide precursor peptide PatG